MPSKVPGSPQRAMESVDYPGSPVRGSAFRSSMPNIGTPPRRPLEQHRGSAPVLSPVVGSRQLRETPRGSPQPNDFRGYRRGDEYERPTERDHLSPVPPYQSPRNSYREWDGEKHDKRYTDRYDSQATLRGEYEENFTAAPRRGRSMSDDTRRQPMQRRTTREVEDDDDTSSYRVKGGVLSQLLRLTGKGSTLRRRVSSRGGFSSAGDLPTMQSLGLKKTTSTASTVFGADELDPDDPRVTGQKKKNRRGSFGDLPFTRSASKGGRPRRASIQYHVAGA
jgi:hypothetical protein